jgi:hypothetical protein
MLLKLHRATWKKRCYRHRYIHTDSPGALLSVDMTRGCNQKQVNPHTSNNRRGTEIIGRRASRQGWRVHSYISNARVRWTGIGTLEYYTGNLQQHCSRPRHTAGVTVRVLHTTLSCLALDIHSTTVRKRLLFNVKIRLRRFPCVRLAYFQGRTNQKCGLRLPVNLGSKYQCETSNRQFNKGFCKPVVILWRCYI